MSVPKRQSSPVCGHPDANQVLSYSTWQDTLEANEDNPQLTEALRSKIKVVLKPGARITQDNGFELAFEVLDELDEVRKREEEGAER